MTGKRAPFLDVLLSEYVKSASARFLIARGAETAGELAKAKLEEIRASCTHRGARGVTLPGGRVVICPTCLRAKIAVDGESET